MLHDETLAVHAGRAVDAATGAITMPLHLSTTFERDADGGFSRGYSYIRGANPVRNALERCLSELEGGAQTVAVGSGMAAAFAVLQSLSGGEHVVISRDMYFGVRDLLVDDFPRRDVRSTLVDACDLDAVRLACRPETKLLWIETPSNPLLEVPDIAGWAEIAHACGAMLICESTFASPLVQRPFEHGADVVVHSLTKYLAGHGDVMGGAVVFRADSALADQVRAFQTGAGAVLAPFDAWLTLRGIETLALRMRAHCANALAVARFLQEQPSVRRVHYPGLESHRGHDVARKQMRGFGGMLSFEVEGGRPEAFAMLGRLALVKRATSLGSTHSLIEHRASIEGPNSRAPESLLRLSVGIEHPADIIADLEQALAGDNG